MKQKDEGARRELAELISGFQESVSSGASVPEIGNSTCLKSVTQIGDAPVNITLKGLKIMMAAERSYAVDAALRVLARNRWAMHLHAQKLRELIEIEAGLRKEPDNKQ